MKTRVALWLLALVLVAVFVSLGRWQLGRAGEKQRMLEAVAATLRDKQAQPLASAADLESDAYSWAAGSGRFRQSPVLLLDNQRRGDQVGVRVLGVLQTELGSAVLIDLGWLPLAGDRRLPQVGLPRGRQQLVGLLTPPPSSGIALGPAYAVAEADPAPGANTQRWLLTRVDIAALSEALQVRLAPRILRLDPALPIGYARDLDVLPNTLPPERHRGYAVQWFGLGLATLILSLLLGFRRRK